MIEGSGSRAGSGSIPLTSGSGSWRPKTRGSRCGKLAVSSILFTVLALWRVRGISRGRACLHLPGLPGQRSGKGQDHLPPVRHTRCHQQVSLFWIYIWCLFAFLFRWLAINFLKPISLYFPLTFFIKLSASTLHCKHYHKQDPSFTVSLCCWIYRK